MTASGQSIHLNLGPPLEAKEMMKQLEMHSVIFNLFKPGSFQYSSASFFDTKAKKAYTGVGFSGKTYQVATLDEYVKFAGYRNLAAEFVAGNEDAVVSIRAFIQLHDQYFAFYTIDYKTRDEFSLYVSKMSPDIVLLGTPILIHSFKELKKYGSSLSIGSSENKAYLLITRIFETRSREPQRFECKALDDSFGEVWFKPFELEFQDKEAKLQSSAVDNQGNLYFLTEVDAKGIRQPVLYSYFWKAKSFKSFKPGLPEGENFGTNMELVEGSHLYLIGLNLKKKALTYVINKVNAQTESLDRIGSGSLPEEFTKLSDKGAYDTENWNVTNFIALSNHDFAASIEAGITVMKGGRAVGHYSYHALIISFDLDGNLKWSHIVSKIQAAPIADLLGVLLLPAQDKTLVIYNDDPDNLAKGVGEKKVDTYNSRKAVVTVQEIDATGRASKRALYGGKELENYSLNIGTTRVIEKNLYQTSFTNFAKVLNPSSITATMKID